jgi:peptidyl-prolyl cis-trans isomerase D
MLKTMRSNMKSLSWILWLVILAFVGFIFVQWGSGRFEGEGLDSDVAAVGDTKINGEEFQQNLARTLEMYSNQFKDNFNRSLINQLGIAEQVLQGMVSSAIIENEARQMRLEVSDAELKDRIRSYPAFQRDGAFIGSEEYERLLAYNRIKVPDFENGLRKELLSEKMKELLSAGLVLDPRILQEEYRRENDKAELDYIAFRADAVKEEPPTSSTELQEFYQNNKDSFKSPEKRSGQVLVLKNADFKKEVAVSEKDMFSYYQENKNAFKIPGKTKISRIWVSYSAQDREEVLKKVDALSAQLTPANFAEKAREMSGDEKAKEGGDWGYWGWQGFSEPERSMIDNLGQGEISTAVDAGQAFSILYAAEKTVETQETFADAKARIAGVLENEQLKKKISAHINGIYEKIKASQNMADGADGKTAKIISTDFLTPGQPMKDIDEMGYISQKMFALKEKEISEPLEFPEGFAIVQLTRVAKPEVEPFDKVQEQVKAKVLEAKKIQLQQARATKVAAELNRLADAKKIEAYLAGEELKFESATYQRGNRLAGFPVRPGLDDTIFFLSEGSISLPLTFASEAVVIVRLKSKTLVSDQDFVKAKDGFYQKKLEEAKGNLFASFIMSKKDDYKIRFNADVFAKVKDYVIGKFR